MQAIGRPVRRGEDRYLGAVKYGQGVMSQAQQQGLQDLSTRMKLEEFEAAKAKRLRDIEGQQKLQEFLMGGIPAAQPATQMPTGTTGVLRPDAIESNQRPPIDDALSSRYDAYEIGTLTDAEKQDALRAIRLDQAAQMASSMNRFEEAENYRNQAKSINDRLGTKFLSREKRSTLSYDRRDEWDKTEYRPRVEQIAKARQLAELAKNPNAITDISLIFGLMKSLDPRSTVRDGEAQMVSDAAGAFSKLMNFGNKLVEGRSLPNEVYPQIVESALLIANSVEKDYKAAVDKRLSTIEDEGLNPEIVVPFKTLNAPDIETEVSKIRQIVGQTMPSGNPAGSVRSIRGGRSGAAQ
jgi:hypothetical protein